MKRIILIDKKWDLKSPAIQYALKASKGTDTEIVGIFLTESTSKEITERAEITLKTVKEGFASEGINFSSQIMGPDPEAFLRKLNDLMPASLVLIGDIKFPEQMSKAGVSMKTLRERFTCPVTSAEALASAHTEKKHAKGINWITLILYFIGSVIMYAVFFPMIKSFNEKIFMTGTVLGALATMVVVVVAAWIWGNTTHHLPKLFKLEK